MNETQIEQPKQFKHLFICRLNRHSVQVIHPDDMSIKDEDDRNDKAYLIEFRNAIYGTNDDREAEALKANKYFGHDYFYDDKNREIVNEVDIVDQKLYDKLSQYPLQKLKSIANEKGLRKWDKIFKMTKEELINLLIDNRGEIVEYDTG